MLQFLHSTATGLFAKILLFLLIASFAVWGIGDIFRTNPNDALVTVGDSVITAQEFQREYQAEQANFRRMLGNSYTNELLMSLDIPQQVLSRLVDKHLLQEEAREQGVVVPESHLVALLRDNPNFQGEDGNFDPTLFRNILASNGLTEALYLSLLASEIRSQMLVDAAVVGVSAPEVAARLNYLHKHETRLADVLIFPPSLIQKIPEPTDAQLRAYYDEQSARFTAPEFRQFSAVLLDYEAIAGGIEIPEEDLLIAYQNRVEGYKIPQTREVGQLLLSTREDAQAALKALKDGTSMEEAARQFDAINEEISLGSVTRDEILADAEEAVFSLKEGGFSQPVESTFGWHLFHVKKIHPARTLSLDEVRDELQREIRMEWAQEEVYALSNRLSDELAVGSGLEDAAKEVGMTVQVFGPVSQMGTGPQGGSVPLPQNFGDLLETIYSLPEGEVSTLYETPNGSYYAARVDSITPQQVRDFADVKDTVTEEWKAAQRREKLQQLAEGVAGQLMNEKVTAVAGKTGATLIENQEFTRSTTEIGDGQNIPAQLVVELFTIGENSPTSAVRLRDGGFAVAKLQSVETPDSSAAIAETQVGELRSDLSARLSNEIHAQYMLYLRAKHGVSGVNQAVLESLLPE